VGRPSISEDACGALAKRGFVAQETDTRVADVLVSGAGTYRYTAGFWERVGALVRLEDGRGWRSGVETPEARTEVLARFSGHLVRAGVPPELAHAEASAALEVLLATGMLATNDPA